MKMMTPAQAAHKFQQAKECFEQYPSTANRRAVIQTRETYYRAIAREERNAVPVQ